MVPLPESVARVVVVAALVLVVATVAVLAIGALADYLSRRAKRSAEERR